MLKNNFFSIGIILCLIGLDINAQDLRYIKQATFKFSMKNVETIGSDNDYIYIITEDSLFVITKDGDIKESKPIVKKYPVFENSHSFYLEKNIIKDATGKIIIDLSNKLQKENMTAKYLAKSKDTFYTCILDSRNKSYSNNISKVSVGGEFSMLCYIVGEPAGIYCDEKVLWYLYNKSIANQKGMLRSYNIKTGDLISEDEIPVINPVGLIVTDTLIFTYSNFSGELIELTKGGK